MFPFYGRSIALLLPFCGRLRGRRFSESCVIAATVSVPAGVCANAFEPSSASVAAGAENVIEPLLPICGRLRSKRFSDSFFVAATFSVVLGAGAIAIAPLFPSSLASLRCGAGAVVIWPSQSQFCYLRWHYSLAGIPPPPAALGVIRHCRTLALHDAPSEGGRCFFFSLRHCVC